MKWFKGTIPEAIEASKEKRTVFVVYIAGEDEISKKMDQSWEDTQVSELCDSGDFVAIRIAAKSEECGFFSQIYPVVVVPSTFFIGENGVPLEVTGGFVDVETFKQKINEVQELHNQQSTKSAVGNDTSDSDKGGSSVSACVSLPDEATQSSMVAESSEAETTDIPQTSTEPCEDVSSGQKEDLQVRLEKAKDLIEHKQIAKIEKEKEEDKQKEKERRKIGQDMQSLKQHQEEVKWKEAKEEIRKDKEEEMKAKQRIREQIARDREERSARYKKEKEEHEKVKEEARKAKLLAEQQAAVEKEARNSNTAWLQVRLPDGSSLTQKFSATDPLQSVFNFVKQHMGVPVRISTTYPRRTFTDEDMSKSLASLQLAPTATVIALPVSSVASVRSTGGIGSLMSLIFAPFLMIWSYITFFLFESPSQSNSQSTSSPVASSAVASSAAQEDDDIPDHTGPKRSRPQTAYKRRTPPTGSSGKVYRISDMKRDDDDDMNTWNGNSTEQM